MYRIAVLGEKESILGFATLGLDIYPVENEKQAHDTFKKLLKDESIGIFYITETFEAALHDQIAACNGKVTPAVILIPGVNGSLGVGSTALDVAVEKAIGANIV